MKQETINALLEMNKDFYKQVACEFSLSRQYPWKGWQKVIENIKQSHQTDHAIEVLDLGCGNARFYKHLIQNLDKKINYCGVDSNEILLEDAQKNRQGTFLLLDIFKDIHIIDAKFDVVVGFGISHHIPGKKHREEWFGDLAGKVKNHGLLIISLWDVPEEKPQRFSQVIEKYQIDSSDLEEGDFLLGWSTLTHTCRYCHKYNQNEIESINTILESRGLKLIEKFDSDGKDNRSNTYLIYSRP